ncbi:hypothetical protein NA56DRAFT_479395 [Hyaloscypha hepaticicola]|uniref:Uncharacterized protein n=1 Tax=Hyaloscypha hepaticicola TaxID=2082293 RepID=A0A2J6PF40_9HELO|nr:hypothetical protein NA56DRAFT_479395 [Hyaloscypha hepaticicola]
MTANKSSGIFSFRSSSSRAWVSSASLLFRDCVCVCDCEAKGSSLSFAISISIFSDSKLEIFSSSVSGLRLGSRLRTLAAERRSPPFLLFILFVFPPVFVVGVDLLFLMPDGGVDLGLFVLPLGRPLLFGADAGVEVEGRGGLNLGGIFLEFFVCFFRPISSMGDFEADGSCRALRVLDSFALRGDGCVLLRGCCSNLCFSCASFAGFVCEGRG